MSDIITIPVIRHGQIYKSLDTAEVNDYKTGKPKAKVMQANSGLIPAIPLKNPVVLKPGREEPWTPYRIIQAFIMAGCPPEAFSYYPTSHEGSQAIMSQSESSIIFGDEKTIAHYTDDPTVRSICHAMAVESGLVSLSDSQEDAVKRLIQCIQFIISQSSLKSRLTELSIPEDEIKKCAAQAAEQWTGHFNPRSVTPPDFEEIYTRAY